MKVLLAKKSHMTQYFDADGIVTPVTVLSYAEAKVLRSKTSAIDGYSAIQLGYGTRKAKNVSKPVLGEWKDLGVFEMVKEFRTPEAMEVGTMLTVEQFAAGDVVHITGTSKGKGFQGAVKLHGFKGKGPIHNARHALRELGSIGGGGRAGGRVVRGKKMPGRMGGDRICVRNLKVVAIDPATKTMLVKGAVPGIPGGIVEIVKA
jgi:large subunit ribosomal protein L3